MAQLISIPLRFRFFKLPVTWEARAVKAALSPETTWTRMYGHLADKKKFSELDGWECRDKFLKLPKNDAALREFLNEVGAYDPEAAPDYVPRDPVTIDVENVWEFREDLRCALLKGDIRENFLTQVTPEFQKPKNFYDFEPHYRGNKFPLRFELTKVKAGVVVVTNAYHMLFATVLADIARGIRSKVCKRKDCGNLFSIESEHERDYCRPYCGHLESVRRNRREAQKAKRREQRKAKRG
jgi:hypothetical protein